MTRLKFVLIMMLVALGGCSAPPPQTVEVTREIVREVTREVTREVIVKETVIVEVTSTPLPPTPTSSFVRWTLDQAAQAIIAAGLEFENPRRMTVDDYGMAPFVGEGIRFLIPSLGPDSGGRLFSFTNQADLDAVREYYESLGRASAFFFSWVFVKDNILIQINGSLPEEYALKYKEALEKMH